MLKRLVVMVALAMGALTLSHGQGQAVSLGASARGMADTGLKPEKTFYGYRVYRPRYRYRPVRVVRYGFYRPRYGYYRPARIYRVGWFRPRYRVFRPVRIYRAGWYRPRYRAYRRW